MNNDDAIEGYLTHCERRNLRPVYRYHQELLLRRLATHLDDRSLVEATTDDLTAYLDAKPRSAATQRTDISGLRSFYGWAFEQQVISVDPARRLIKPKPAPRLPRPMPDVDVKRALAEAPCSVAPILNLAVYAGLRACEIAQLQAEDITHDPPMIRIRESKGGGESTVPIAPLLADVLSRCPLPRHGWLFPGRDGHLSRSRICQLANRYLDSLGIDHTLHTLRHAYGTAIYRATRDLRLTQELMRHRSIQSTVGYTKLAPDDGSGALAGLRW